MAKKTKACEECEQSVVMGGSALRENIWLTQLEKREIYLNANVDDEVVERVVIQIQNINEIDDKHEAVFSNYVREPIKLFIHTNGGCLYSALSVCSVIETSKTPVHTIALGKAFSAGFLILMCGHERYAQIYSTIMYHGGSSGLQGGHFASIMEEAKMLENLNKKIQTLVTMHTDVPEETLHDVFQRKADWYLDVQDALTLGVIDEIYGLEPSEVGIERTDEDISALEEFCDQCKETGEADCDACTLWDEVVG